VTLTTAKWTVEDYPRIVAAGILEGRQVELLNGAVIEMAPEGESHAYSSDEAGEYLIYLLGSRAKVRQAKPITLPQSNSEPEPDIAIVQRLGREYQIQKNNNRANVAFRQVAQALTRSKSALGQFYRRMRTKMGAPKAITATAHKLARIVYPMLKHQVPFAAVPAHQDEAQSREQAIRQLQRLGVTVVVEPSPQPL
jgi:hypothetical protein